MKRRAVNGRGAERQRREKNVGVSPPVSLSSWSGCEVKDIPIEQLEIDPMNIRENLALDLEFTESIADRGVIHAPVVRPRGKDRYGVVVGARRFTAARSVGQKTLRCEVRELDDAEAMALSMIENRQRKDIPVNTWIKLTTKLFNRLSGTREERIKKIVKTTPLSDASVRDYLNLGGLSPLLQILLKKPEERSKPEKELLTRFPPVDSEKEAPIGEKVPKSPQVRGGALPLVPERVMRVLARDTTFRKWDNKEPGRALKVAVEAAGTGGHYAERVIEAEEREKQKELVVRRISTELRGPPPPLKVQLGRPIMDALEKYVKDKDIISPEIAVKIIVGNFLTKEGYCGKWEDSNAKREVSE